MIEDCEHRYSIRENGKYICELCNKVAGVGAIDDINVLAFYAFLYGLGRMTYAVSDIAQALIRNKHRIRDDIKIKICSEIQKAIDLDKAGMDCDIAEWKLVLEKFKCMK